MPAYYNEIDPYAADWLENLIAEGHIAPGVVDRRSIVDVIPSDLEGFAQVHLFAGIGIWSAAARDAGWPDDRPLWSASCPCQPFSAAGQGAGFADERHLWPAVNHLLTVRRPPVVIGEQVASGPAGAWIDLVQADLEAVGYAFGAVAFPAASVGAPHIRDRAYWLAHDAEPRQPRRLGEAAYAGRVDRQLREPDGPGSRGGLGHHHPRLPEQRRVARVSCEASGADTRQAAERAGAPGRRMAYDDDGRREAGQRYGAPAGHRLPLAAGSGASGLALADRGQRGGRPVAAGGHVSHGPDAGRAQGDGCAADDRSVGGSGPTNGFWRDADWLFCRDGKWRPAEPGSFVLAHGQRSRVGRLRAYGNQIVRPQAALFVETVMEILA